MTITLEDLRKELSEIELTQLSDINATGAINLIVIDDAIEDTLAFIESFFTLPASPTPLLQKIGVDLAIYELRRKNALVGEEEKEARRESESYLLKMARGLIPKSITQTPSPQKSAASFQHARRRLDTSTLEMP